MHSIFKLSLVELPWEYVNFYFSSPFQEGEFSFLLTLRGQAAFPYPALASGEILAPSPVSVWE